MEAQPSLSPAYSLGLLNDLAITRDTSYTDTRLRETWNDQECDLHIPMELIRESKSASGKSWQLD